MLGRRTRGRALSVAVAGALALAGCSTPVESNPSTSSGPTIDCTLARTAMDDYSVALSDLATSLEAGDAMSAVAAADAMSYSLDQLEGALPGIPSPGRAFLDASRAVALKVKQSAADSPAMSGLLGELTADFSDPAFAEGGDAIDAYADQACPEPSGTSSP